MRRSRSLREYRDSLIRNVVAASDRRKRFKNKNVNRRQWFEQRLKSEETEISPPLPQPPPKKQSIVVPRRTNRKISSLPTLLPAAEPLEIEFLPFSAFTSIRAITVCHVIESVGLGGAQIMSMELINGLRKYYPDMKNYYVYVGNSPKSDRKLFLAYDNVPINMHYSDLREFCESHSVDIVVQHRISNSLCLKKCIPRGVKYILINHTWNMLSKLSAFRFCDVYVSVCTFLKQSAKLDPSIHSSRSLSILNGIESDFIEDLPKVDLGTGFNTGRCHRLTEGKFKADSLRWMATKVRKSVVDFKHHLIGASAEAKILCKKSDCLSYLGPIVDRNKKMSIIKSLDLYFYETFQHEGASIALLESLACGVPVVCKALGGCPEIVINNVNGFIVQDRSDYMLRMKHLSDDRKLLERLHYSAIADFDTRLHVRHASTKYAQLFEKILTP